MQGFLLSNRKKIVSLQHQDNTDIIRIILVWLWWGGGSPHFFYIHDRTFHLYISTILCNPSWEFVDSCVVDRKDYKKGSL